MSQPCPECGAPVPDGGTCRDNFHALLLLEAEIPGTAGSVVHFYAVAAYALQHPDGMNLTQAALAGLRAALADSLGGRASLEEVRRRARQGAAVLGRVTRRPGDGEVMWPRGKWTTTVADVCTPGPDGYADRVVTWACSVLETLAFAVD